MRGWALTALGASVALAAAPAQVQAQSGCIGQTSAQGVPQKPGLPLRFGITPGVQTGQLGTGPQPPRTPEDPAQQVAALHRLAPPGVPLVLRLHRFFWSDGEAGVAHFLNLASLYTREGFPVELQLRYHPTKQQEGDIAAWTGFVREVVDRFGPNPRVVGIQVTNEVNLADSPDSSDGAYNGGIDALIQGVIAAKDEARRRSFDQLAIGFNWAYRAPPSEDQSFWNSIRDKGGRRLVASLDWIGLDAYPGTFFPPADTPGGERDAMVNAMSSLRCFAEGAGIPDRIPIYVEENGWPTGPGRSDDRQAQAMDAMVRAVSDFRGTYNVSDYRWFDLRDSDSTSPNFQQQYGILRDDYSAKPAFGRYHSLIDELSIRPAVAPPAVAKRRAVLRVSCRRHRRWRLSARVPGARRIQFLLDGRVVARDGRRPFRRSLRLRRGRHRIGARALPGGLTLTVVVRGCSAGATTRTVRG